MHGVVLSDGTDVDAPTRSQGETAHFTPPKINELAPLFPQLEILDLIGHGGMGAVYKARQLGLNRIVALKILPRDTGTNARFADRFTREARALASLSHPNIVALHDFGETEGLFYFVMEYVDGTNLRQVMQDGKLSASEALGIVPKVCDALQFAHEEGIVHRDVKPENILLDKKGRVKIADFGLAKLLVAGDQLTNLTATRQVIGTPHYMAPEQMERPLEVDHRADIYSLGVVFYEMLTGELPLGRFEPPSHKVDIDVRLDEVVLRTLAKEPELRYQRVSDIRTRVDTIVGEKPPTQWRRFNSQAAAQACSQMVHHVANWLANLPWDRIPFKEISLTFMTFLAFMFGLMLLVDPPNADMAGFCIPIWLFAFVLARVTVSSADSWQHMTLAHWCVFPALLTGYLLILAVALVWPAIVVAALGLTPVFLDVPGWELMGFAHQQPDLPGRLPPYWLMVGCACATAMLFWCVLVSLLANKHPQPFSVIFHPASPAAIKTAATYVMFTALFVLGPIALALAAILSLVQ